MIMSDRFKIIDHATFEQMQKSNSRTSASSNGARIRNAKYRRMTSNGFDLMQFMKNRHDTAKDNRKIVRNRRVLHFTPRFNKKKGKQSENGRKRHKSRLKKTILRNRQMKSKSHQEELQLANQIQAITLNEDEPFGKGETKNMKREATLHSSRFRRYACSYWGNEFYI